MKHKKDHQILAPYRAVQRNGRVMGEHRYIMEQHLGRRLRRDEHVHHKNGSRLDNRLDNLELLSSAAHCKHHGKLHAKKLPKWAIDKIRRGASAQSVAGALGVCVSNVFRKLRRQIPERVRRKHPWTKPAEQWNRALDMFFSKRFEMDEIAKHTGISKSKIYKRASKDPRYDRHRNVTPEGKQHTVIRLHQIGWKIKGIADEVGVDRSTVWRIIKRRT